MSSARDKLKEMFRQKMLQEKTSVAEEPQLNESTINDVIIDDEDRPEDSSSESIMSSVQEEVEQEQRPVIDPEIVKNIKAEQEAENFEKVQDSKDYVREDNYVEQGKVNATSGYNQTVDLTDDEELVVQDLGKKHEKVEQSDNSVDDIKKQIRKLLKTKYKFSNGKIKQYPKHRADGSYAYFDEQNINSEKYDTQKHTAYNALIDQINGFITTRQLDIAEEQKERTEAFKEVTKAFENGSADITPSQAKEVSKVKAIDANAKAFDNEVEDVSFAKKELSVQTDVREQKQQLTRNKGVGPKSDLEFSKDRLLLDNLKLQAALKRAKEKGDTERVANITSALMTNTFKLESLTSDIEREKKALERIAKLNAIDEALDEQEDKQIDSIQLNGREFKCKTAIVKEDDWKDLTNALDKELIDEETSGKNRGYCNMYNSIMLRRLITHYVIKQFGSTKKINSIYVKDLHLYVNDTLVLYQGNLFSPDSIKRVPKDVLPYFKNGMLAPFFDWGIFYKGINCGGRPLNLRELYFDDAKYLSNYLAPDISDLKDCKKKEVVQSPYSFMNPDMYFTLFKNLLSVTIQEETFNRKEWDEIKNDEENQRVKDLKGRMKREKRRLNLLDGYKLDVYAGTNGFQSFGISSFTNYVKNRGNKGFLRFALGSSMRFVFAGAGIITNLATHLIGGIYHSLKSENEYQWNDNIKDKMDGKDNSPITSKDTDRELQYAREMAKQGATDAE